MGACLAVVSLIAISGCGAGRGTWGPREPPPEDAATGAVRDLAVAPLDVPAPAPDRASAPEAVARPETSGAVDAPAPTPVDAPRAADAAAGGAPEVRPGASA